MSIQKLAIPQLKVFYDEHLTRDFPANERRSYENINKLMKHNRYEVFGYFINNRLVAYACIAKSTKHAYYLLDYYAVIPSYRNQQIGGTFLKALATLLPADGLIIEVETPDLATTPLEYELRQRRVNFYLNNGAIKSRVSGELFHVHFTILYYPIHETLTNEQLLTAIEELYQELVPINLYQKYVHLHCV